MPDITTDEVISNKHKRNFIQFGGARPSNKVQFAGQDTQYLTIEGVGVPETGGINPVWVHDPSMSGKFKLIGRTVNPPDLAKASVKLREKHGAIPRQLLKQGCKFNLYELTGTCGDLSDFTGGWNDYVLIYSSAIVSEKDLGTRTGWDKDDVIEDSLSITLADVYPVGSLSFGEGATSEADREIVDVTYGPIYSCIDCDDGTQRIYSLTTSSGAGSPGLPPEIQYSLDGGATWAQMEISGIGATEAVFALDIVGNYLVVLGTDAIFYSEINKDTGVPEAFTEVTTGFLASYSPNDMYVAGPREIYFCGDGGYIYKSTDITAGVTVLNAAAATSENLLRIKGSGQTIVAVGANGAIVKSTNGGTTWATTTTSPTGSSIVAVEVLDTSRFYIGTSTTGSVYYTTNGGETWTALQFSGSGSGNVWDIMFATDEVGYISHSTTTPTARVFSTWDGGADWSKSKPRIMSWPTFQKAGRLACPKSSDAGINANNLLIGGVSGGGTDGILLVGTATKK